MSFKKIRHNKKFKKSIINWYFSEFDYASAHNSGGFVLGIPFAKWLSIDVDLSNSILFIAIDHSTRHSNPGIIHTAQRRLQHINAAFRAGKQHKLY